MAHPKNNYGQRDFTTQSLDSLLTFKLRPPPRLLPLATFTRSQVLEAGDRRLWQPDASTRPPHTPRPGSSRVKAKSFNTLKFADPRFVGICVRRKIRKEVLFATKKTRKGSGGKKHRNFWSTISC